jgi:LysM repeat protein
MTSEEKPSDMPILMSSEREQMDLEILPEYVREVKVSAKDPVEPQPPRPSAPNNQPEHAKSDMLEALWPGVHHDFANPTTRRPKGVYLTVGFAAGVIVTLLGVWGVSSVFPWLTGLSKTANSTISQRDKEATDKQINKATTGDSISPISPNYQVQAGDTLAEIALRNYKRISPRLLDEICRANNMKSADVLTLGQKIVLPEYHPQSAQSPVNAPSLSQ